MYIYKLHEDRKMMKVACFCIEQNNKRTIKGEPICRVIIL